MKCAHNAYYYALYILKGRFELGETLIANSIRYSYRYAKYILKGRFELGEKSIATDDLYKHLYAIEVAKLKLYTDGK